MATWEQKDPRWLVDDRDDGKNVNGWHWQEHNRLTWSRQRLADLCTGLPAKLDNSLGHAKITGLKEATGEAVVTLRKGNKKLALFDLALTLSWEGKWAMESKDVTGTLKITEFSSSSDPDEYCFCVTADGSGQAQDNLKVAVEGLQEDMIKLLQQYVQDLAES